MVLQGSGRLKFTDRLCGCGISPDKHEAGFAFILPWQALTPVKREVARHQEGLPVSLLGYLGSPENEQKFKTFLQN